MINWIYYPLSDKPPETALKVVKAFEDVSENIDSTTHEKQVSDKVLSTVADGLRSLGFSVESGKKKSQKVPVPVLFGINGELKKYFEADAYHFEKNFVVEVEAGRAVTNYQFLKDLFQACMMHKVYYLAVAVRNIYKRSKDFQKVNLFFETLYASGRLELLLNGILIIGY
jgi:hypothetical protein